MNGPASFRLAAAQYPVQRPMTFAEWAARISDWVEQAADGGAALAVFPEYGMLELAGLSDRPLIEAAVAFAEVEALRPRAEALFAGLAARHALHVLAPSGPALVDSGRYRNRAVLFGPDGPVGYQDKLQLTPYERGLELLEPGDALTIFDTPLGRLGVLICYDSQFPLVGRALAEAGAAVLLAPSCTDALTGYHRVRAGCRARAVENQCYSVQSPLLGTAAWLPAIDVNHGAAGIFGPPDHGFPEDGIIATGEIDAPGWVFADLDFSRIAHVRVAGEVGNFGDWSMLEVLRPPVIFADCGSERESG